jgi:miniconductance mechanosensitive channel
MLIAEPMTLNLIPTHALARWLVTVTDALLDRVGVARTATAEEVVYTAIIVAIALLLGWLVRTLIVFLVNRRFASTRSPFIEDMIRLKVVSRSSHAIPPLVFLALVPVAFATDTRTLMRIEEGVLVYFLVVLAWSICTFLEILWKVYDRNGNTRNLPLKGILNIAKGGVVMVCTIVIVSILLRRSPLALLTGLGAFAAALMLVFRDSLLGFVAGIQLSTNDMLHVGDWIVVPDTVANGIVTDVSLTAVKIRNWDNTTVTMPPYALVQNGFQNWTQMKKRGRRQIERSVLIDVSGVRPATAELLERCRSLPFMAEYIDEMQRLAAAGHATAMVGDTIPVNGSLDTNLGLLRAYAGLFISHHPWVAQGKGVLCMVRLLEHTPHGIPLQVFCYVNTVDWVEYEGVSSDIFEHIIAAAPMFGLSAFSYPTGRDVVNIAGAAPAAMPYYGDADLAVLPYAPRTNFVVPPNTAGDPGYTFSTVAVYPADEGVGAAT